MATTTITDLPSSRALDYKAMSAIRAQVPVSGSCRPSSPTDPRSPVADDLTLQTKNINVNNSAAGASINVGEAQNALTVDVVPVSPQP